MLEGPDLTHNDVEDAFVAKISADGTELIYAGYIGGSDHDRAFGIAVEQVGSAYITGDTLSTEDSFPVMIGPDLTYNDLLGENQSTDAFVAKVNPEGTGLDYCGYIGGSLLDSGSGIAVDLGGNAYVTGTTVSSQATFPVTVGPDVTFNLHQEAFVAKVAPAGTALSTGLHRRQRS